MAVSLVSTSPQFLERRKGEARKLSALAGMAFDVLFEAEITGPGLEGTVHLMRDIGPELGYAAGEFPQDAALSAIYSLMHPDDQEPIMRARQQAVDSGLGGRFEYRMRRKDGNWTWWDEVSGPTELRDGRMWKIVGAARNITTRKTAEQEVLHHVEELRAIKERLQRENLLLRDELHAIEASGEIIGSSPLLRMALHRATQVALTDSPVLITGETGTGKELMARAVHHRSARRDRPLVCVNCAALSSSLIESELFGHEKGAFTGATSRHVGYYERADGATLFLDEVGDMPADVQAKLLRAVESGEFQRVGGKETLHADVRLISATNQDLAQLVEKRRFRDDLYYRLSVFPIEMPSLRARREDVPMLVAYLVERRGQKMGKVITDIPRDVMDQLAAYDWPGNVRELRNVIERALILSHGSVLTLHDRLDGTAVAPAPLAHSPAGAPAGSLHDAERRHILSACEACHWKIKGPDGAAARLGLNPSTLYFRLKKLGLSRQARA